MRVKAVSASSACPQLTYLGLSDTSRHLSWGLLSLSLNYFILPTQIHSLRKSSTWHKKYTRQQLTKGSQLPSCGCEVSVLLLALTGREAQGGFCGAGLAYAHPSTLLFAAGYLRRGF